MATATRKRAEKTAKQPPPGLRLEWMRPEDLADNPANWRRHPERQTDALSAALASVGWAGALLYNEQTKRLIDGHARKAVTKTGRVPVLVGSWTEEQEKLILATLDPLAALAEADTAALDKLLRDIRTGNDPRLDAMLAELAADQGIAPPDFQPTSADEQGQLDKTTRIKCPECGHEFTPSLVEP